MTNEQANDFIEQTNEVEVLKRMLKNALLSKHTGESIVPKLCRDESEIKTQNDLEELEKFREIRTVSTGVIGWHKNGNVAEWGEFDL